MEVNTAQMTRAQHAHAHSPCSPGYHPRAAAGPESGRGGRARSAPARTPIRPSRVCPSPAKRMGPPRAPTIIHSVSAFRVHYSFTTHLAVLCALVHVNVVRAARGRVPVRHPGVGGHGARLGCAQAQSDAHGALIRRRCYRNRWRCVRMPSNAARDAEHDTERRCRALQARCGCPTNLARVRPE
jgi:hypothetical protein